MLARRAVTPHNHRARFLSPRVTMNNEPVWEDHAWAPLSALRGDVEVDVCVIGLGGSGLAAVQRLLQLGQRVAGVDTGMIGGGAAGRNGGFLLAGLPAFYHDAVARFGQARVRALYLKTIAELDRMTAETPSAVRRVGSLRIADDAAELDDCDLQLTAMRGDGLPVERYDGIEGRGLMIPTDGAFNPLLRCRLLAKRALEDGALLFESSPATEIAGQLVRAGNGTIHCKRTIVAVDGGLDTLLPELAPRVRSARLQMLATEPVPSLDLPRPVYQRYGYEYWQQLPDRRIVLGGLRDRAGESEWTDRAEISDPLQLGLEAILRDQLHVSAAITHRWAGVVGYTTSGLPVVEQARPDVWAIGGYSGTGNVLGALCGRGVAELVVRGNSTLLDELVEMPLAPAGPPGHVTATSRMEPPR
jgi:gamma-glutamylputrescine oxidase